MIVSLSHGRRCDELRYDRVEATIDPVHRRLPLNRLKKRVFHRS